MEFRDVEIFLALADTLHFGQTAEQLFISQGRVSQVIKKLERQVGASLFERTSRRVHLTAVGQQLRNDFLPAYASLRESVERARMSARGVHGRLRVGLMPFNFAHLHHFWRTFRVRNPQWEIQVRLVNYADPFGQLRRGDFDVFVAWLPINEPDLTVGPALFTDPRIVAVSEDHPLALKSAAPLEVFSDFPIAWADLKLGYWEEGYMPFETRTGRLIDRSQQTLHAEELITAVGMAEIIMPFPSHVTEIWRMPTIRWLPLPDLPPLTYVLVWRSEAENDMIRALAATIRDIGRFDR
ncbi:LysR family transcriptional regulator [Yinghuangia aomiensis]|uniref:LysR family transcriptional regulator n=1 Tax=Yinghuangia aomiensis TaxID=676205 RepID=A0ABP9ID06_9ACTN